MGQPETGIFVSPGRFTIIGFEFPITNIESIQGLLESIAAAPEVTYTIQFSYSLDLVNYTEYEDVSELTLQAIPIDRFKDLDMRFKVTNTHATLPLQVLYIGLEVKYASTDSILSNTVFNILDPEDHQEHRKWCMSLIRKIYTTGIIPIYVERGDGITDRDYIDFWRAVICFWGIFVIYARRFESLDKEDILRRLLDSKEIAYRYTDDVRQLRDRVESAWEIFEKRGVSWDELSDLINYQPQSAGELFILPQPIPGTGGILLDKNSGTERYIYNQKEVSLLNINSPNSWFIDCVKNFSTNEIEVSKRVETDLLKVNPLLDYELVFLIKSPINPTFLKGEITQYNGAKQEIPWETDPYIHINTTPIYSNYYLCRVMIFGCQSTYYEEGNLGNSSIVNGKMDQNTSYIKINLSTYKDSEPGELEFTRDVFEYTESSQEFELSHIPVEIEWVHVDGVPISPPDYEVVGNILTINIPLKVDSSIVIAYYYSGAPPTPPQYLTCILKDLDFKIVKTDYEKSAIQGLDTIDGFFKPKTDKESYLDFVNEKYVPFNRTLMTNKLL